MQKPSHTSAWNSRSHTTAKSLDFFMPWNPVFKTMQENYHVTFESAADLKEGDVIRRVNASKDHQGRFVKVSDDGGLMIVDVINLKDQEFVAEAGVIRPEPGDTLLKHKSRFGESEKTEAAMEIIQNWPLYRDTPDKQTQILEFITNSYSPEEILSMKKKDALRGLFVPIQQKFEIGRFAPKINWEKVCFERFQEALASLYDGKHITYVAFIPTDNNHDPKFFTIGTKPHVETVKQLEREMFGFKPTTGGHIKITSAQDETPKKFIVDAGSNEYGGGVKASISTAESVTDALEELYPEFEFTPVKGRDAYGIQQSY